MSRGGKVHFVGIGGSGMAPLAELLLLTGHDVSGSDACSNAMTRRLGELGARIHVGHADSHVNGAERVVISSAIPSNNPELVRARNRGLAVLRRGELLAELFNDRRGIAVSGAHGKTTTTAMISLILLEAGLDPTFLVGSPVAALGGSCRKGGGALFVAETDESDGSFLALRPWASVLTNLDAEHLDFYRGLAEVTAAFEAFARNTKPDGFLAVCADSPPLRSLKPARGVRIETYGLSADALLRGEVIRLEAKASQVKVFYQERPIGELSLSVPGLHNVSNALAAVAVGRNLGIPFEKIAASLGRYAGAQRRFEILGEAGGVLVIDDYAHHPTEIRATISAAKLLRARRLWVVFQPHRFSRVRFLMEEFSGAFEGADRLLVADIYAASESPVAGLEKEELVRRLRERHPSVEPVERGAVARTLAGQVAGEDVVLFVGAGDLNAEAHALLGMLREKAA